MQVPDDDTPVDTVTSKEKAAAIYGEFLCLAAKWSRWWLQPALTSLFFRRVNVQASRLCCRTAKDAINLAESVGSSSDHHSREVRDGLGIVGSYHMLQARLVGSRWRRPMIGASLDKCCETSWQEGCQRSPPPTPTITDCLPWVLLRIIVDGQLPSTTEVV